MAFDKALSTIRNFFNHQQKPSKGRVVGVACGTVFMVVGLDIFFLQQSLFKHLLTEEKKSELPPPFDPFNVQSRVDHDKNPVGRLITVRERETIMQLLGESPQKPYTLVIGEMPLVILHDTAGEISSETLHAQKQDSHGPLGDGITAYIPRDGEVIITRPTFFTPNRPTATAYEKGLDFLNESQRNRSLRTIWQTLDPKTRQTHLRNAIAELDPSFVKFTNRAALWLGASSERAFEAWQSRNHRSLDGAKTTAIWAIGNLCQKVLGDNQTAIALVPAPKYATQLRQTCQRVNPTLQANRTRVGAAVNVELIQQRGSDCFTADIEVRTYNSLYGAIKIPANRAVPLMLYDGEAYTDDQYEALKTFYLKSVLAAGRFPQMVTHYWLDQGLGKAIGDHCDPRGLNLTKIYSRISDALGHPPGTIYGIKPQYGRNPQKGDNVWWSEAILGPLPRSQEDQASLSAP
jgi:hypothetical protein